MKLNWGMGILIFILLFMAFILSLVYKCSQQKVDLVNEKYYEQELIYQQHLNKLNNTAAMNEKLLIEYSEERGMVEIHYPSTSDLASLSGNINFFKPDNADLDFNIRVQSPNVHIQMIPVNKLKKGWWNVRVNWTSAGTSYYREEKFLNK